MPAKSLPSPTQLPEGFSYVPEFLSEAEEAELLRRFRTLDFRAFDFHGYTAKRRVVEYGWEYDFGTRKATSTAAPFPAFLLELRNRVAVVAGIAPEALVEAIITEYPPGAPIGWHRDAPQFGTVIGISLGSACRMRLKPYKPKDQGKIVSTTLEPRSLYIIQGPARWKYQHSIPAVKQLRYSITFRTTRSEEERTPR
jgi:alkylated DNA repair dioxygenase AlkB